MLSRFVQRVSLRQTSISPLFQFPQRFASTVTLNFEENGEHYTVQAPLGETILDVALENDIEIEGACGGELACSTCHVIVPQDVYDKLPPKVEEEEDMLDLAWGLTDTSRLCCQLKVTEDLEGTTFRVPEETLNQMA